MLSIIIPTLNEEKYLPKLLESIKKQDYKNCEVIVADANSTDKTKRVAKRYGCKIVDGGMPAKGRNNGAKKARGNYLLFLDADVVLPKNFLGSILQEFKKRNLDITSCYVYPLTNKKIDFILHRVVNYYMNMTQYFYPHAPGFCILTKKEIHEKIRGFNEKIKLAEDHDYVKRANKIGMFRLLHKKVFISTRRLDKDGRLNVSLKYLAVEVYRIMMGEIESNIFNYYFEGYEALADKNTNDKSFLEEMKIKKPLKTKDKTGLK